MFRWGVLSTARIGWRQVIPAILESHFGVLSAVASRDAGRARDYAARFGAAHAFGSYDELLASDAVDGVYIPLPNTQHVEWTLKAAKAGKHVLCEKPLAMQAAEIDAVIAARDENRVLVSEAFAVFHHPQWAKLRELIASGAIGRLRHVQGAYSYFNVDPDNIRNQMAHGGGALRDIGVYPVMVTRMVAGREPLRVRATIRRDAAFGTDVDDSITVDFGDFELSFYCSTRMALRQVMTFHGENGFIEVVAPFNPLTYDYHRIELHNVRRDEAQVFRFPDVRQYVLQVDNFARAAQGQDAPVMALENSAANQRVIDALFASEANGDWRPVLPLSP